MIGPLIGRLVSGEMGTYFARLKSLAMLYAMLSVFGVLTAGFLFGALFTWLAHHFGGIAVSLGFAGLFLVLVLVTLGMIARAKRIPRRRTDDALKRDIASIAGVAAISNAPLLLTAVAKRRGLLFVPVAAAAGWGIWRLIMKNR